MSGLEINLEEKNHDPEAECPCLEGIRCDWLKV
jgi:hypothetical protein